MSLKISFRSATLFVATLILVSFEAHAKYNVCTVTINSSDEADVFRSELRKDDFNFIELTDYSTDKANKKNDWFERACQAQVSCDVLVVSGHFGGSFFGSTGMGLSLKELSSNSCRSTCDGILKKPKEVYLFGCNTLATKDKDARDQQSYTEILVADGIDRREAERVSAARYGPFGSAFKDQMERSFEGVPLIYGFNSVGPSGKHVRPQLKKYLNSLGDFRKHLESIDYKKNSNPIWFQHTKAYHSAMGQGLRREHPGYVIRENSCRLEDDKIPLPARIDIANSLLSSDPALYLPNVASFINETHKQAYNNDPSINLNTDDKINYQAALSHLSMNQEVRKFWIKTATSPGVSMGIRFDLQTAAGHMGLVPKPSVETMMQEAVTVLVKNPTTENVDLLCSSKQDIPNFERFVRPQDYADYQMNSKEQYKLFGCFDLKDPKFLARSLKFINANKKTIIKDAYFLAAIITGLLQIKEEPQLYVDLLKSMRVYKGPYQAELMNYIDEAIMAKALGAEQIETAKRIASKKIEYSSSTFYHTHLNPRLEPETELIMIDNSLKHIGPEIRENHSIYWRFKVRSLKGQDYLAMRLKELLPRVRLQVIAAVASQMGSFEDELVEIASPTLLSVMTRGFIDEMESAIAKQSNYSSLGLDSAGTYIARYKISQAMLEQIDVMLASIEDKQELYGLKGTLRHILYQRAIAGDYQMTEKLKSGHKYRYKCTRTSPSSTTCTTETYQK